jgi:hypothetical protein
LRECYNRILAKDSEPDTSSFKAIELGSGAVGLPGISLGWMLSKWRCNARVLLTDNDSQCLAQLEANVQSCLQQWQNEQPFLQDDLLTVHYLDWGDGIESLRSTLSGMQRVDLVIGSELVYNPVNALACYSVVESMLQAFPGVLVIIVQVVERDGWKNVFLSNLQSNPAILVHEASIPLAIHEAAAKLVPMGGALDRFDFGVCYISSRANEESV